MMFGFDGCCCESCTIFRDTFSESAIDTTKWSIDSGDWSQSPSSMTISGGGSNALIRCLKTLPLGYEAYVVSVGITVDYGNTAQVIFGYTDTENYYYAKFTCSQEQYGSNTLAIYHRSGGGDAQLSTVQTGVGYTHGGRLKVCVTSESIHAAFYGTSIAGTPTGGTGASLVASIPGIVGLGTNDEASFGVFSFSHHATEKNGCPSCETTCTAGCKDSKAPMRLQFTLSGLANTDRCSACTQRNGTWILDYEPVSPLTPYCVWRVSVSGMAECGPCSQAHCSTTGWLARLGQYSGTSFGSGPYTLLVTEDGDCDMSCHYSSDCYGQSFILQSGAPLDCMEWNDTPLSIYFNWISPNSEGPCCDHSSVVATITAINL